MKMIYNISEQFNKLLITWIIPLGMFLYMAGQVFFKSNSGHISQTYTWLMLPTLLLLIFYGGRLFSNYKPALLDSLTIIFLLMNIFSFFWSDTQNDFRRFYLNGLYIFLFLVSLTVLVRLDRPIFFRILEISTVIVAIGAIGSIYYHFIVLDMPYSYRQSRIFTGPWGYANLNNPIPAGLYFGVFALIAFIRLLELKVSIIWRTALFISLIGLQTYVMLTWSRGPMYALFAGYMVLWFLRRDWHTTCLVIVLGLSSASIGISSGMISMPQKKSLETTKQLSNQEAPSITQLQDIDENEIEGQLNVTFNHRGTIWFGSFEKSMKTPWFGHGANSEFRVPFDNGRHIAGHSHSLFLQTLYETGFVGLSLFLLLYVLSAITCWKFRKNHLMQLTIALFVFGILGFATDVSRIFRQPDPYWLLFWLPLGMTIGIRLREQLGMLKYHCSQR